MWKFGYTFLKHVIHLGIRAIFTPLLLTYNRSWPAICVVCLSGEALAIAQDTMWYGYCVYPPPSKLHIMLRGTSIHPISIIRLAMTPRLPSLVCLRVLQVQFTNQMSSQSRNQWGLLRLSMSLYVESIGVCLLLSEDELSNICQFLFLLHVCTMSLYYLVLVSV